MHFSISQAIFGLFLLHPVLAAEPDEVRFFYSPMKDACEWGPSNTFPAGNNTNNGGVCAYIPNQNRLYACPAPDPNCWTFYQTCKSGTNSPGSDQILCGRSTGTQWCCGNWETCTVTPGQINICISQFASPNAGKVPADAAAEQYSVLPSASIVTNTPSATPSAHSTRRLAAGTTTSSSSSSTGATSGAGSSPSSTSDAQSSDSSTDGGLSGGAIAGIVIGIIAVVGIIAAATVYLILHKRRAAAAAGAGMTQGHHEHYAAAEKPAPDYYASPTQSGYYGGGHSAHHNGEVYAKVGEDTPPPQEMPLNAKPQELP